MQAFQLSISTGPISIFRQTRPGVAFAIWPVLVWLSLGVAAAAPVAQSDWDFPRGDSSGSGATTIQLPETLQVGWEFKADEAIETTPIIHGNQVFVADVMGTIYAIDRESGKELWRKAYDTGFFASPIYYKEHIILGDLEGNVYALAASDGTEKWKQTTQGEISGSAAIYENRVLVASQDGKLYCFDFDTGKLVWTYEADDQIRCAPTVAGDRTFLGGCDAKLHIVDLKTGQAAGDTLELGGPTGSTPAVRGDLAIVPIMDGAVFGFDWKKKKQLWLYEDPLQTQEYRSSAAISSDVAIVSSQRKNIDAIDLKTGDQVWRHTLKRRSDASPVIAGKDVWITASDGRLLRLSLDDGSEKWTHEIRGSYVGGVAITQDGLFVADDEGVVRYFHGEK